MTVLVEECLLEIVPPYEFEFLVSRCGDVVALSDSMKTGARRHTSSTDWGTYYGKWINFCG